MMNSKKPKIYKTYGRKMAGNGLFDIFRGATGVANKLLDVGSLFGLGKKKGSRTKTKGKRK